MIPDVAVNWWAVLPHTILAGVGSVVLMYSAGRRGRAGIATG